MDFKKLILQPEYDFLRTNEHLGDRIILLGLGGSYAYGTNTESSDIDFRGIALPRPSDLLGLTEFDQVLDTATDTVVYSFPKIVRLLLECNPNTIELLGLDEDQYFIKTSLGQELLDNAAMFLSKRAIRSFGGYADAQLRRLQNAIARDSLSQSEREQHIFHSVQHALEDFNEKHRATERGTIRLYIDEAVTPELDTEIFMDMQYQHLPLREYEQMWNVMHNVVRQYDKIGKRNKKKDDNHLNKHSMHLIRLFMMAIDILDKGVIKTHRTEDLELLRKIRNGAFMKEDHTFTTEFYDILTHYEQELERAARETSLPEVPDMEQVGAFVERVNRRALD